MPQVNDSKLIHPEKQNPLTQIESFRNQVANKVFFGIALATPFVFATGLYRTAMLGWKPHQYWQLGFGLLIIIIALLHRRIGYRFRVWTMICIFFFLGIGGLLTWGLMGMGLYFFVFASLIANLCFGARGGFALTLMSLGCMAIIALATHYQWVNIGLDLKYDGPAAFFWIRSILVTGAFLVMLQMGLHRFFLYLTDMIKSLDQHSSQLLDANRRLELEIAERRRTETALRDSEMKYRMVVDNANEGIVVVKNERILFANNMILNEIDYPFEELTRKNVHDFFHPEDLESSHRARAMILEGEINFYDQETRLRDGKGGYRWFKVHSVRTLWENRPAIISFLYEITAHKVAEAEKTRLQSRLKQAQKMEILGTLVGSIAHDLNNVLMGVTTYPAYLLSKIPEDDELHESLVKIEKSGEKALAITQDMLTLARRRVKATAVCNLNHIVNEFLQSLEFKKMHSYKPSVLVETTLVDQPESIQGSPLHLSKTIMNLVSNALDSITTVGRICIATENRTLSCQPDNQQSVNPKPGRYVVLKITDTGSGMHPDDIEKIFDPFYTKKTMGRSGTGLGMVVVWNAVKDHGGYIEIESIEGLGTTFTLFFPAIAVRAEILKPEFPALLVKGNSENILVVDDIKEHRQMIAQCLTDLGYKCATVAGGPEAIEHIKTNQVDLVVLDMIMDPGPDGLHTYKQMRDYKPDLKAVIISGFQETEWVQEAQKLGAGRFLEKPFKFEELGAAVQKELHGSTSFTPKPS